MYFRFAAVAALSVSFVFAQADAVPAAPETTTSAGTALSRLRPDDRDPLVARARERAEQVRKLVAAGALPPIRLQKAQDDLQDALDMSMLKQSLSIPDLLPEEADQLVAVAQRTVVRRQQSLLHMQEMVGAGIISRSEAETSMGDLDRAKEELEWAESRSRLVAEKAEFARMQKNNAGMEAQMDSHPDWAGKVYTHYQGSGVFTTEELQQLETDYAARFDKPLPISAMGQTALHTSLGFDHRGRVDVAVTPDQPEGLWLRSYLEARRIPYFAFRAAVPHKATGAHIHVGPESTKLAAAD